MTVFNINCFMFVFGLKKLLQCPWTAKTLLKVDVLAVESTL